MVAGVRPVKNKRGWQRSTFSPAGADVRHEMGVITDKTSNLFNLILSVINRYAVFFEWVEIKRCHNERADRTSSGVISAALRSMMALPASIPR